MLTEIPCPACIMGEEDTPMWAMSEKSGLYYPWYCGEPLSPFCFMALYLCAYESTKSGQMDCRQLLAKLDRTASFVNRLDYKITEKGKSGGPKKIAGTYRNDDGGSIPVEGTVPGVSSEWGLYWPALVYFLADSDWKLQSIPIWKEYGFYAPYEEGHMIDPSEVTDVQTVFDGGSQKVQEDHPASIPSCFFVHDGSNVYRVVSEVEEVDEEEMYYALADDEDRDYSSAYHTYYELSNLLR